MNRHPGDDLLQDHVSGILSVHVAAEVEAHLESCTECRADVDSLRSLTASLAELPSGLRPERDLRPGIWRAIDSATSIDAPTAAPDRRLRRWQLAAAAVALVSVTAVAAFIITRDPGPARQSDAMLDLKAAEARYAAAVEELEQLLGEQREMLSPTTLQLLDASLKAIDIALAEARAALDQDPGNPMLSRMLIVTFEKKLGVLRTVSEAPVGI